MKDNTKQPQSELLVQLFKHTQEKIINDQYLKFSASQLLPLKGTEVLITLLSFAQ